MSSSLRKREKKRNSLPNLQKKITNPQPIQYIDEFISSFLQEIWIIIALHHFPTEGSSAVNGCRQNESPNS